MKRKLIPCEFKENIYKCKILGETEKPLNCKECNYYTHKKSIPQPSIILKPYDYSIIAGEITN